MGFFCISTSSELTKAIEDNYSTTIFMSAKMMYAYFIG